MSAEERRYPPEEVARRGDEIYEQKIRAQVEPAHIGKVVAIDIETGDYVLDDTLLVAARRLRVQHPDATVWAVRVGHRAFYHIGGRKPLMVVKC